MKMKMLAIAAVLAIAFAVLAFVPAGADNNDADDTTAVASVTLNVDKIEKYYDAKTEASDKFSVTVTVTLVGPATEATTVNIVVTGNGDILDAITAQDVSIEAGASTGTYTFADLDPKAVGEATLVFTEQRSTAENKSASLPVTISAPTMTVKNVVAVKDGEAKGALYFHGNVDQKFTVSATDIAVTGGNDITLTSTIQAVEFTITPTELGVQDVEISETYQTGLPTATTKIFTYDATANAVVQGYGIDETSGVQIITYSDGTALLNLSKLDLTKVSHVQITEKYGDNSGTPILTEEVNVAAQKYIWLDLKGIYSPVATEFISSATATATLIDIASTEGSFTTIEDLGLSAFVLTMDADVFNGDKGYYEDITTKYTEEITNVNITDILKKNHPLVTAEITKLTPANPGYVFKGYALESEATEADIIDFLPFSEKTYATGTLTIEDLIFAYGIGDDDNNKIYAVWVEKFNHVYLGWDATTGSEKFIINEAFVAIGEQASPYVPATDTGDIHIRAPSSAKATDLVLVRMSQTAPIQTDSVNNAKMVYTVIVYAVDPDATDKLGSEITSTCELEMLANGIWTVKGIDQDVIIVVVAKTDSALVSGYDIAVQSVKNAGDGKGTAIATFSVNDVALGADAQLSMTGTYFKTISGHKVYGNIDNLGYGLLTYTAIKDYTDSTTPVIDDGKLSLADAVEFSLTMTSAAVSGDDAIGFYAVKAVYTATGMDDVETPYALGEVA